MEGPLCDKHQASLVTSFSVDILALLLLKRSSYQKGNIRSLLDVISESSEQRLKIKGCFNGERS